jgi:hypothetical protein
MTNIMNQLMITTAIGALAIAHYLNPQLRQGLKTTLAILGDDCLVCLLAICP